MTLITGRSNILRFQLLQHIYGLRIQRDTGLKHSRGSLLRSAQQKYGIKARRVAPAIEELEKLLAEWDEQAEVAGKSASARADESVR
jgi:hypothetical protein